MARHWSGQKVSPHKVRLACGCGFAEPGSPHYLLTDPGKGQALCCARHYQEDVAEAAPRAHAPEDGQQRVRPRSR